MTSSEPPRDERKSPLPQRVYRPRVAGMLMAGLCVAGAMFGIQSSPWAWAGVVFTALLWPHIAYRWSSRHLEPHRAEERNCLIDSALAGFWVAAMQFQVLPALLVLAMPTMDASAVGGPRLVGKSALVSALGIAAGALVWGWRFNPEPSLVAQLAAVPFLLCYPILFGSLMYRLVRKLDRQREALRELSERDALSGVYNRRYFERRIAQEFDNFRRHVTNVSLVMVDIDDFKSINDTHGHTTGDEVIRLVGRVLQEQARRADVVARFGGDEFAVLLPFTDTEESLEYVLRVQDAYRAAKSNDLRLASTAMSFGIATPAPTMENHEQWIAKADAALYRAKSRHIAPETALRSAPTPAA